MAILRIEEDGVWKEIPAIKGATGHDVYVGDKSKTPSEAKLIIEPVKGTATGTNIQVTDSANDRVSKLVLDGKSTQETTSGKNLFNIYSNHQKGSTDTSQASGVQVKYNEDGSITLNGTATKRDDIVFGDSFKIKYENGKDYYMLIEYLGGSRTLGENARFDVAYVSYDGTNHYININIPTSGNVVTKLKTYTNQQYFSQIRIYQKNSGNVYNNFRIRISVMNDSNQSYEPYTGGQPSPSPDYPSEIENIKGKNLLPEVIDKTTQTKNGITLTFLENNKINLKGTSTATTVFDLLLKESTKITKDIYVHFRNNGTGSASIALLNSSGQFGWCNFNETNKISKLNGVSSESSDINKIRFFVNTGQTIDITFQPSLEYTSAITRYVPYGNIQIVETGKNLLNEKIITKMETNYWESDTTKGITLSKGTYYISSNYSLSAIRVMRLSDKTQIQNRDDTKGYSFSINETTTIYLTFYNALNFPNDLKLQLEKGPIATPYEPYTEEVVNIDLKGNELCSLSNGTKDELIVKDGRAKIVKRIGKVVLDGSDDENWLFIDNNQRFKTTSTYIPKLSNIKINKAETGNNITYALSNYYTISRQSDVKPGSNKMGFSQWGGVNFLYLPADYNTVDKFKTWLSTHNTIVQYELKTPEEIDLGEVSTLTTYEGTSNITNSEDTNMSIEYDTNKTNLYYQNNGNIIKMNIVN